MSTLIKKCLFPSVKLVNVCSSVYYRELFADAENATYCLSNIYILNGTNMVEF